MKNNEQEVDDFKEMARELGVDSYILSPFWEQHLGNSPQECATSNFYPLQNQYKRSCDRDLLVTDTCRWAWSGSVINWDGTVVPCCYDYNETYIIGNVFTAGFKEIWNNKLYRQLRAEIKTGRKNLFLCSICPRAK